MSIHYIGKLQRTPGKRACGSVSGQADSRSWHATDCRDCKMTLKGLRVRWLGTELTVGTITEILVVSNRVGIDFDSGFDGPSFFELDNSWEIDDPRSRSREHLAVLRSFATEKNDAEMLDLINRIGEILP